MSRALDISARRAILPLKYEIADLLSGFLMSSLRGRASGTRLISGRIGKYKTSLTRLSTAGRDEDKGFRHDAGRRDTDGLSIVVARRVSLIDHRNHACLLIARHEFNRRCLRENVLFKFCLHSL